MSCIYVIGYVPDSGKGRKGKCQGCKEDFNPGDLRVGTESTTSEGKKSTRWKHWGCAGTRMLTNIGDANNLEGLGDLKKKDQDEVHADFTEHGQKKAGGGSRGSGKAKAAPAAKKGTPAKKKAKKEEEEESEEKEPEKSEEEEPAAGGADEEEEDTGAEEEEGDDEEEEEEEEEEEPAPAKGKRGRK